MFGQRRWHSVRISDTTPSGIGGTKQKRGWMNYRTATLLEIQDTKDAYIVITSLHGVFPDSMVVQFFNDHLIIEGQIQSEQPQNLKFGRYTRRLMLDELIDADQIEAVYLLDGRLIIRLPKIKETHIVTPMQNSEILSPDAP